MNKLIIMCVFLSAVLGLQNFPVPHKQIGIFVGDKNAEIQIELVYDPICDNTADFDKKLLQIFDQLTEHERKKIALKFIVFPLPFHMSAHKIVQSIIYVLEKKGSKEALELMRYFLKTKDDWFEMKVREQSIEYLTRRIAQKINKMFNLSLQKTMQALKFGSKADKKVREWSKITMGVIKAAGTPRMSINRAPIDDVMFITTEHLRSLIKQTLRYTENNENIDQN